MKKWIAAGAAGLAGLVALPFLAASMLFGPPPLAGISMASSEQTSCTVTVPASTGSGALTAEQVAKFAYAAGFRGQDINIAVAVARAESGWRPKATLLNTNGSTDHGLFQINSIHAAILAGGNWADPGDNAKMAFTVWTQAGRSWSPWVTYWRGTYRQYLTSVDPKPVCTTPVAPKGPCKVVKGHFANGQIPASALCTLWTNRNHRLRGDAANGFDDMSRAYMAKFGVRLCLTDSYRSLAAQIDVKRRKGFLAATPGTSNHGWGVAVDLCARGTQENPQPWNRGTEDDIWLHQNAPRFGWLHPGWAEPGGSKPEPWHWQYGTQT